MVCTDIIDLKHFSAYYDHQKLNSAVKNAIMVDYKHLITFLYTIINGRAKCNLNGNNNKYVATELMIYKMDNGCNNKNN